MKPRKETLSEKLQPQVLELGFLRLSRFKERSP